ncbi:MAG: hypothetical protein ABI418_01105, partial [Jatrophihabitantaceae bacterium]
LLEAQKFVGGQRWQLKGIPNYIWLEEEARAGFDIDKLRRQMLSDIVNKPTAPGPIDWLSYDGIHWRTVYAILREFESAGYIRAHYLQDGPSIHEVTPLAKRALRNLE